jgi:pilus assembly protein Flp/PilA
MTSLTRFLGDFLRREDGPTAVEYAVMMALIIVVCVAAVTVLGSNSSNTYNKVGSAVKTSGS